MPKKILLADDSITIQKVVELTFSDGDYEVTAVNNGAKAVQKLSEMRPDIILSDIIMPEKNGYEVCEYVKSHPDFRNIPVVLLTGTFEPFDPDRAEKAGCDAVVTKPFESQSLIHKVEELIAQAQLNSSAAAAAPPAPPAAEAPSPWMDETASTQDSGSSFSTASGGFPVAAPESFTHDADIFAAAPSILATTEMPFEVPPTPSFDSPPAFGSDTPFGEEAAPEFGGETRAFPRMSFEEMQQMAAPPAPAPAPSPWDEPAAAPEPDAESPFGAPPPPEEFSSETRAIPRMSLEDLQRMATSEDAETPSASPEPSAEAPSAAASPWDEQAAPAFGGETRAFPKLNFDDFHQEATTPAPTPASSWDAPAFAPEPTLSAEPTDASPFGGDADAPAFGGETRAFPKLNFDDFQQMTTAPEPEPQPEPSSAWANEPSSQFDAPQSFDAAEPAEDAAPVAPLFESPAASPFDDSASPFRAEPAASTFDEEPSTASQSPWSSEPVEEEPTEMPSGISDPPLSEDLPFAAEPEAAAEEPAWSLDEYAPEATKERVELDEPGAPAAIAAEATPAPLAALAVPDLTDEQVERIARRVVELLSDKIVRNIAWEVIPDLAEMAVKERIRQLEAEA